MQSSKNYIWIFTIILFFLFMVPAFAEVKIFEKEVEEPVSSNQTREQVEAFALQKAKRLAVEEAGTYISSLTVVQNYQLQKDEVTALASGIVQAKVVGIPAVRVENGIFHVKVRARIDVDTSILDRQVQEIMKEKGTLKKLEEEREKNKELEEKLANLKSTELKRLEELNAQAIALERERDKQRLLREEQALKARDELSKAEADRIAKEREMQDRISRTLMEQEKAKRDEAAALAAEQDKIKRAQLENEQRWSDLSRKAKLSHESWVAIDDSLSLKQAMTEVYDLKQEIANLNGRLDYNYKENIRNLKDAYTKQLTLTTAKLPPAQAPKDAFETTTAYNQRISTYERQMQEAEMEKGEAVEILKQEENLKLAEAKVDYLEQQLRVLAPFVKRLKDLQSRKFTLPDGGAITVEVGEPDADNNRFPVHLQYKGESWSAYWNYSDRDTAKDFYLTRTYLKAEGLFQIEEAAKLSPKLTAARVSHLGTKEMREFSLEEPRAFTEMVQFAELIREKATAKDASEEAKTAKLASEKAAKAARDANEKAARLLARKEIGEDDSFTAYDDGTVLDTRTNLMWAAHDNGESIIWLNAKSYCENYRGGGYTDWRMPTQAELAGLYDRNRSYPTVGWIMVVHLTKLIRLTGVWVWASEHEYDKFDFMRGAWLRHYQSDYSRALPVRSGK